MLTLVMSAFLNSTEDENIRLISTFLNKIYNKQMNMQPSLQQGVPPYTEQVVKDYDALSKLVKEDNGMRRIFLHVFDKSDKDTYIKEMVKFLVVLSDNIRSAGKGNPNIWLPIILNRISSDDQSYDGIYTVENVQDYDSLLQLFKNDEKTKYLVSVLENSDKNNYIDQLTIELKESPFYL